MPHCFQLIGTYSGLLRDVRTQRAYVRKVLEQDIALARQHNDGSLDEEDFSKIRKYYGFGVPAIVGEGFCTLRGIPMTAQERQTSTCQGALTGLYDDFFDKSHIAAGDIRNMMDDPLQYHAETSLEKLFVHFLSRVHSGLPDRGAFTSAFDRVYNAQQETILQLDPGLIREKILEITATKGGVSLLFYRSAFAHPLRQGEENALYLAGGLMQLGNDIFDVYKDHAQGIRTLVTSCRNIIEVRDEFNMQLKNTFAAMRRMDYPARNIKNHMHKFLLGMSRCWVCLDQLEKLEEKSGGRFSPGEYSRSELVCDMEKAGNILRSLRYYLSYPL